jgi:hypothetical protein
LDKLVDPGISVKGLLSLRQLAVAAHEGLLTAEEAAKGAARLAVPCADLFSGLQAGALYYSELAEALGAVLKARFTAASDLQGEELGDDDDGVTFERAGRDERPEV